MPTDRSHGPWAGTTYKGFSGAPSAAPPPDALPPAPAPAPGRSRRGLALAAVGVVAAVALGLGFGFWSRPDLGAEAPSATAATRHANPAGQSAPGAAERPIPISPGVQAAPAPPPGGKLETLPPEMAAATQAPGRVRPAQAPASAASPADSDASDDEDEAQPAEAAPSAPPPMVRASVDCAGARTDAEQLVCSDPALAAEDRRLSQAYRRALDSGVDPYDLRQEQRDWLAIRDDAARHSPGAVAQVYEQRIQELNRMADAADDENDGDDAAD